MGSENSATHQAYTAMRRPVKASVSPRSLAMVGSRPMGRTSVVTKIKAASARESTGTQMRLPSGVLIVVIISSSITQKNSISSVFHTLILAKYKPGQTGRPGQAGSTESAQRKGGRGPTGHSGKGRERHAARMAKNQYPAHRAHWLARQKDCLVSGVFLRKPHRVGSGLVCRIWRRACARLRIAYTLRTFFDTDFLLHVGSLQLFNIFA